MVKPDMDDPRWKRMAGNRCFCSGCGEYFNSIGAFDAHQLVNKPCLEPTSLGMEKNSAGYWRVPAPEGFDFTYGKPKKGDEISSMG